MTAFKKYVPFIIFILFFSSCGNQQKPGANGVIYTSALDYNNYIVDQQKKIIVDVKLYGKIMNVDYKAATIQLDKTIATISSSLKNVQGMPPYENDSTLRDAAVNLFTHYKESHINELREMLAIQRKFSDSSYTDQDIIRYHELDDNRTKSGKAADKKMEDAEVNFMKKHSGTLPD